MQITIPDSVIAELDLPEYYRDEVLQQLVGVDEQGREVRLAVQMGDLRRRREQSKEPLVNSSLRK